MYLTRRLQTVMVLVLLFVCVSPLYAQRKQTRRHQTFEMTFCWRGDQQFSVSEFPLEVRDVRMRGAQSALPSRKLQLFLTDGFDCTFTYSPYRIASLGVVFTSFKQNDGVGQRYFESQPVDSVPRWYGVVSSESRFGLVGCISTPWISSRRNTPWLVYRAKMGGRYDMTGLKLESHGGYGENNPLVFMSLGRIHEHQFFMGFELGVRYPNLRQPGVFFLQLMYFRSMFSFPDAAGARGVSVSSNTNETVRFAVGIAI